MLKAMAGVLAGMLLSSCVTSGPKQTTVGKDPLLFRSYSSHSADFFEGLLSGRVFVHEHASLRGIVRGEIYRPNGRLSKCYVHTGPKKYVREPNKWKIETWGGHATRTVYDMRGRPGRSALFFEPVAGTLRLESLYRSQRRAEGRVWVELGSGWVQESWPRVLADGCPGIKVPAGMAINEKQTSQNLAELRRQDPDAPISNAPGSELTAPGRVGLIDSNWGPTTTREEIGAFMDVQRGNVMLSPMGHGYVFVEGYRDLGEVWRLAEDDGRLLTYGKLTSETDKSGQEWVVSKIPTLPTFRYPVGYPFPMLPTGHRHAAFQLTDRLVEAGEPVALPWMPAKWKDFTFLGDGKVRARRVDGGPDRMGRWLWTEGRLRVDIDGNREAPEWKEVAEALGMEKPKLWTPADGQRIGPPTSTAPATSGAGKCAGDYRGTASWTLGADGKRVWDTSGCRPKQEG